MTENKDKYNLYTEKIKERPWAKYKTLIHLVKLAAASAFAGLIAGIVFLVVIGMGELDKDSPEDLRHEVTFSMEEYPGVTTVSAQENPNQGNVSKGNGDVVADSSVEGENSDNLYDFVATMITKISPSMTTVTAINQNEDPLFSIVQDKVDFPGIIIADNEVEYLILTDYAIKDVDFMEVTFVDGTNAGASFVMADKVLGIAVIAVEHEDVPEQTEDSIKIVEMGNSYMLKQGELVIAMGNLHGIKSAVDFGTASSTKEVAYEADSRHGLIHTNMSGAKDNCGFLFNDEGMLIGNISSNYSSGNIVAYGISDIKIRVQNLTNRKKIGYLGIIAHEIDDGLVTEHDMPVGVYVTSVEDSSPAYFAGILNGDIITDISGRTISNVYNVERTMCEFEPGTEVQVTVNRRGRDGYVPIVFTITLGER